MGKKKFRKTYVSKGQRVNVDHSLLKSVRRARTTLDIHKNKITSWSKGQNPWLSVPNPNCDGTVNTNKRNIRIRANDYWGDPRAAWSIKPFKKEDKAGTHGSKSVEVAEDV